MAARTPQDMSNEELLKNESIYKTSVTITFISCVLIFAIGVYLLISKNGKINVFLFLPIIFAGSGYASYTMLKGIRKEKTSRNI